MASCQRTKNYVTKRTAEGKSKREIMRCLKRYAAREYGSLIQDRCDGLNQDHPRLAGCL